MCSVGEPLNPEAVRWGREAFGLDFHDTFWQTETGVIMITNLPGMPVKPGSMGRPFPALEAAIVEPKTGEPITEPGRVGLIAIRPPWPSMMRTYWNNTATYYGKFLNGWYICGDQASLDEDGYFWFSGRDDDVINTGGHLVGPVRDRERAARAPGGRRVGGHRQARPGEHGGREGVRGAAARFHAERRPRAGAS